MKLREEQWAMIYKKIRDMVDYGEGDLKIKVYDNRRLNITGGKRETIIGYDDGDEKVCI